MTTARAVGGYADGARESRDDDDMPMMIVF
jgi:hypothetical protein